MRGPASVQASYRIVFAAAAGERWVFGWARSTRGDLESLPELRFVQRPSRWEHTRVGLRKGGPL